MNAESTLKRLADEPCERTWRFGNCLSPHNADEGKRCWPCYARYWLESEKERKKVAQGEPEAEFTTIEQVRQWVDGAEVPANWFGRRALAALRYLLSVSASV